MTPGSLPPLSPKARALLSAEREISPRPELERRRAVLRARTVLWHAQQPAGLPRVWSSLVAWWRRGRLVVLASLAATSAFAAWIVLEPERAIGGARGVESTVHGPAVARAPSRPLATAFQSSERAPVAPRVQHEAKPVGVVAKGTQQRPRPTNTNKQSTSSEELALLDRARRAVAAGDFRVALQAIERHARSFPKSQLGEEREALRVKALGGAGLSKQAGQAARRFESSYPKSVLVPELQDNRTAP